MESDLESEAPKPQMPKLSALPKIEEVEKPIHELLSHSLVDIYVGDDVSYPVHEKLLCYHSPVLRKHFYAKSKRNTSYGLQDEEPAIFEALLSYLYSSRLPESKSESEVGPLLDLYLLSEKLGMARLSEACVDTVRTFYQNHSSYPALRRVQYVYENTESDNPMREMMVGSVARFLTLGQSIPKHWAGALQRNGPLAVDIIRAIQEWHLESRSVPDAREGKMLGLSTVDESVNGDTFNGELSSPSQLASPSP